MAKALSVSVLLVSCLVIGGLAVRLPKDIKRCKISDRACITEAARKLLPSLAKPIPELSLSTMEPLKVPDIIGTEPLKFKLFNSKIYGFTASKINEIRFDTNKKILFVDLINTGELKSNYTVNGRLLVLPVNGEGRSTIKMTDVQYFYNINYDIVKGKDNKKYLKLLKHTINFEPKNVEYKLTNLFNGNKQLADVLHQFVNENWRDIFDNLGKPAMVTFTRAIVDNFARMFSKIPYDELFES